MAECMEAIPFLSYLTQDLDWCMSSSSAHNIWHVCKICSSMTVAHGGAKEPSYLGLL